MPFPKRLLHAGETIRLDLRPHWWYLVVPSAALVGSLILWIIAVSMDGDGFFADSMEIIALGLIVVTALWAVVHYARWWTTNFVITTDRVVFRHGLIAKSGIQIPLDRVNNVNFHQGIFERMIGAGDLLIESAGESGQQRFTDIKHPDAVTNLLNEAIEAKADRRAATGTAPPMERDVVDQIERLEGLLQRGSISQEEFDAQKRKLLG